KEAMHTSWQTGQLWLDELLKGHPERFRRSFGMHRHVFRQLIRALCLKSGLAPTKHLSSEEQVAIFLRI
ncbi:hypothetical protein B0H12DRAFT_987985, partial [Mycena haematopus]